MRLFFIFFLLFTLDAHAKQELNIVNYNIKQKHIYLTNIKAEPELDNASQIIKEIINQNLTNSNHFKTYSGEKKHNDDEGIFLQYREFDDRIDFVLETSTYIRTEDGKNVIAVKLIDIDNGNFIINRQYTFGKNAVRKVAHTISDIIYTSLTGKNYFFNSQFVFTSEERHVKGLKKSIAMMDQDGYGYKVLVPSNGVRNLYITPTFNKANNEIYFVSINDGKSMIQIFDIKTNKTTSLNKKFNLKNGNTLSPCLSSDGSFMIYSHVEGSNTNLYKLSATDNNIHKLTDIGLNVSCSIANDNNNVVYQGNKTGRQSLYLLSLKDNTYKIISKGKGAYAEPIFSPDGNFIAFIKIFQNTFNLGVMDFDGENERILYTDFFVENPVWSPDGRKLLFSSRSRDERKNTLKVVDIYGNFIRNVDTPHGASDPDWLN